MAIKGRPTMLNGINPLSYVGVNPYTPPGMYNLPRDPTVRDNAGFQIGDYWLNQVTNCLWYLAQKSIPPLTPQDALWIKLSKASGCGPGSSAFSAGITASIPNATGAGTGYDIIFDEVYYNTDASYDGPTGTYTAPYTGLYQFNSTVSLTGLDYLMGAGLASFNIMGTGPCVGFWGFIRNNPYATEDNVSSIGIWRHNGAISVFLNAGDTVQVRIQVDGGAGDTATIYDGGTTLISTTLFTGYNITCTDAPDTPVVYVSSFPTDAGTAVPSNNVLNVFGGTAGRDINTTGSGNTIHVELNNAITLGDLAPINSSNPALTIESGSINFTGAALIQRVTWPAGRTRMMADGGATYFMDASANTQSTLLGYGNAGGTNVSNGNSSFGYYALSVLTVGATSNTAVGSQAGRLLQTGSQNTIVGANSFASSVAGTGNSVLGRNTLPSLLTGVGNIALGRDTGTAYTGTESYNILFSNIGVLGESNTCRIASGTGAGANQLNKVFFSGIRGITTDVNDAIPVLIDSAGQLGTISSSIKYKENVSDMGDYSSGLLELRPVTFNYKDHPGYIESGLIAEEVAEVLPELVIYKDGQPETVKYHLLVNYLLNELQKLEKRITELESR